MDFHKLSSAVSGLALPGMHFLDIGDDFSQLDEAPVQHDGQLGAGGTLDRAGCQQGFKCRCCQNQAKDGTYIQQLSPKDDNCFEESGLDVYDPGDYQELLQQVCEEAWPGFGIVNPSNFGKDHCHLDCNLHNSF
ncbi:MAG: hypothetical protein FRX49_06976 [Trebouxia sp. A1-2]|nr:MAG: hypothetical protein FRX49_06976 [Trebouxia sp. A1-2]